MDAITTCIDALQEVFSPSREDGSEVEFFGCAELMQAVVDIHPGDYEYEHLANAMSEAGFTKELIDRQFYWRMYRHS